LALADILTRVIDTLTASNTLPAASALRSMLPTHVYRVRSNCTVNRDTR